MTGDFKPCTSFQEERYIDAAQPVNPHRSRKQCEDWHDRAVALQALNAELLAALKAMQNWAAKFESMLEYESLKDEKQFGKEHQETWQLIKRAESQQ